MRGFKLLHSNKGGGTADHVPLGVTQSPPPWLPALLLTVVGRRGRLEWGAHTVRRPVLVWMLQFTTGKSGMAVGPWSSFERVVTSGAFPTGVWTQHGAPRAAWP